MFCTLTPTIPLYHFSSTNLMTLLSLFRDFSYFLLPCEPNSRSSTVSLSINEFNNSSLTVLEFFLLEMDFAAMRNYKKE